MKYGYARVSTQEQCVDGQVTELEALGCDEIIMEKASAKSRKDRHWKSYWKVYYREM